MIANRFSKYIKEKRKIITLTIGDVELQDILGQNNHAN